MGTSFDGKVAVVTGASRGIGRGIAARLAHEGARVAVVSRALDAAHRCAEILTAEGGRAAPFQADVGSYQSVDNMARRVAEHFGGIDIVCANAGIFPTASLERMSPRQWDEVMDTNARGSLFTVQACLPWLRRSKAGRIVLTSSVTGPLTGYAGWSHYGASKAAQIGFMRSAALELARHQITINAVLPGNVLTEGLAEMGEEYLRHMSRSVPLGRLGDVDDIAQAVLFFASCEAAFVTGQTLVVDGGQVLPENLDAF